MSYAAGFAAGERQAYCARAAGAPLPMPEGAAPTEWEQGRRDALHARSPAWSERKPKPEPSKAVARADWGME